MAVDEGHSENIIATNSDSILKEIDLKNVGFLDKQPTLVECPACQTVALSLVRLEAVTWVQSLLNATKLCKTLESRSDVNHYCSKCGCFIGRHVPLGCVDRCLSRRARRKAARDALTVKEQPTNCAEIVQEKKNKYKEQRALKKAEKKAKKEAEKRAKVAEVAEVAETVPVAVENAVQNAIQETVKEVEEVGKGAQNELGKAAKKVEKVSIDTVDNGVEKVKSQIIIETKMVKKELKNTQNQIDEHVEKEVEEIKAVKDELAQIIKAAESASEDLIEKEKNAAKDAATEVKNAAKASEKELKNAEDKAKKQGNSFFSNMRNQFGKFTSRITGSGATQEAKVKEAIGEVGKEADKLAATVDEEIVDKGAKVETAKENVKQGAKEIVEKVETQLDKDRKAIADAVNEIIRETRKAREQTNKAKGTLNEIEAQTEQRVQDEIEKLLATVTEKAAELSGRADNVKVTIKTTIKEVEKEGEKIGEQVVGKVQEILVEKEERK